MVVHGDEVTDPPVFDRKLKRVLLAFLVDAKRTQAATQNKKRLGHRLAFLDQNISFRDLSLLGNGMDVLLRLCETVKSIA